MKRILPEIISLGVYDASLIYKKSLETSPRRVWMYEIELILEDGGMTHIDGRSYPIKAGNVIIGKPSQMRHTTLPFKCLYIHLTVEDEELNALFSSMPDVYTPSSNELSCSFDRLITTYSLPNIDAGMQTASCLCAFLAALINDTRLVTRTANYSKKNLDIIERAIEYMDANICQNITLEEIAEHVYLSRIYFHRLFVSATGKTPYQYLLERRMSHAQKLMITTNLSIGRIARECGFSSQSYFNQVFRREIGCTPIEYKKQMSLKWFE